MANERQTFDPRQHSQPRVLVVEDDPTQRVLAVGMLRMLGFAADAAENGAEAVKAVQNGRYAFVLMDCAMPVMDGYQAAMRIRARGFWSLPIVALTAFTVPENRETCLNSGMDGFLGKPLDIHELAGVLKTFGLCSSFEACP